MVMIFGALVENDDISRCCFQFFKILIFWVFRGGKWQKTVQNDKNMCVALDFSGTIHHMIVIYGTHV